MSSSWSPQIFVVPFLLLFFVGYAFGGYGGNNCEKSDKLYKGFEAIKITGKIKCGDKPLYAAYIQLVDDFQAVNDVIAHGHSDRQGQFSVKSKFYYYSDTDLAPPRGQWKLVIYSYCGVPFDEKNHCHRVFKQVYKDPANCLQRDDAAEKPYPVTMENKVINIPANPPAANPPAANPRTGDTSDKVICLEPDPVEA